MGEAEVRAWFRATRLRLGIAQRQIGMALGLRAPQRQWSEIERGGRITLRHAATLAVLGGFSDAEWLAVRDQFSSTRQSEGRSGVRPARSSVSFDGKPGGRASKSTTNSIDGKPGGRASQLTTNSFRRGA